MLSSEALLAHARERGMPPGRLRGIVREYVAVLALKSLAAGRGPRLLFLGGTALRLGHGLPRFSEDLDFDARGLSVLSWKTLLATAARRLARVGFDVEAQAGERRTLLTGALRFRGLLQAYGLAAVPGEKLRVTVEANRPSYPLRGEPRVVSGYGEMVPVVFASPGLMFAEKILALTSRALGRDLYDVFFMAGKRWVPDPRVLRQGGIARARDAILGRLRRWSDTDLMRMARQLEPFLFEPEQVRLVAGARRLLPPALEYLRD